MRERAEASGGEFERAVAAAARTLSRIVVPAFNRLPPGEVTLTDLAPLGWTPARVLARLIGFRIEKSSLALSPSPSAAKAITAQMAACVYWPPFSRTPGG